MYIYMIWIRTHISTRPGEEAETLKQKERSALQKERPCCEDDCGRINGQYAG
jgi:hypothetical protein